MSLLELQGIGKIYVSDGNVSVGIRGVDLSFERGEFVAVTGKSGSGKSTLLNVISGLDSYEEGELFIEGQPTSHYLQPDWEEYRQKYISFIFQDYNIIESYTVLENVELALMHIDDRRARRARALELIDRVGLSDRLHQRGSRLSGGQKQRTVIARALAKDSPIILADEPTGNLDSASAAEIIELLREVSRDRLLIVVTHNFDEVEEHATRHIRIHDGAVSSDHTLSRAVPSTIAREAAGVHRQHGVKSVSERLRGKRRDLRNGLTLGASIFRSRPKLSAFICLLLLVGTLGVFFATSICFNAGGIFDEAEMFRHIDGRVILTGKNGSSITSEELDGLVDRYGATDAMRFDMLLDCANLTEMYLLNGSDGSPIFLDFSIDEPPSVPSVGRLPLSDDEAVLYLPLSFKDTFGETLREDIKLIIGGMFFRVCGIDYYYDNNITPQVYLTERGFETLGAVYYLFNRFATSSILSLDYTVTKHGGSYDSSLKLGNGIITSFDVEPGKVYINNPDFIGIYNSLKNAPDISIEASATLEIQYFARDYSLASQGKDKIFRYTVGEECFTDVIPESVKQSNGVLENGTDGKENYILYSIGDLSAADAVISDALVREIAREFIEESYIQSSLFFEDDRRAAEVADELRDQGYIAVTSDTEYIADPYSTIVSTIELFILSLTWLGTVAFLSFFVHICSVRTLDAFSGEMAIMRSMGIPVRVIRIGMYVRMFLSLIPALMTSAVVVFLIFTTPATSAIFNFLYPIHYIVIFIGMNMMVYYATRRQIRRLFGKSVKSALRGGDAL